MPECFARRPLAKESSPFTLQAIMTPADSFEIILGLLAVVVVLELAARRLGLPPSAVMVLGGVGLALTPGVPELRLDPDLILVLFLPPLLFSGAYFTVWRDFRANLRIIVQLAVGAVGFSTLVVGVVTHLLVPGLPWAACFTLGAIVSPPDAVAAKAVLQGLPLPPRLITLLEGESLVNDAAGLVLFRLAIAAGVTGAFSIGTAALEFSVLTVGGVLFGVAFGWVAVQLLGRLKEPRLNIVAGFLTAWASYILGDHLHVSGVLATVAAGLVLGRRQHERFGALTRIQARAVWSVAVFILESLVFILIGLALRGVQQRLPASALDTGAMGLAIAGIILALIAARFAWIGLSAYVVRFLFPAVRRRDPYPSPAILIVMGWAGMRGVVSLAIALSIPVGFPGRDFITVASMAVILVSILVQGTTLRPLIRVMKLQGFTLVQRPTLSEPAARALMIQAELSAVQAASRRADGTERYPHLVEDYRRRAAMAVSDEDAGGRPQNERREHISAVMAANRAGRQKILALYRAGAIHDVVLHALEVELDLEEVSLRNASGGADGAASGRFGD